MNRKSNWTRIKHALAFAFAIGTAAATINIVGCSDDNNATTTAFVTDPYVYYSYYPADVSVSAYYWADDWAYAGLYALNSAGGYPPSTGVGGATGTAVGTAGTTGTTAGTPTVSGTITTVADAVRALARGEVVCANHVTVAAKTLSPVCTGGPTQSRSGVTLVFTGCQTPGGGTIDGTIDVSSTRTATTAACTGTTSITLSHTTTITNLSYTAPSGIRLVIPSQTDTGTNTYGFGQNPAAVALTTTGQLQTYAADGTLISDTSYSGSPTISFAGSNSGYTVDGTFTTTSNLVSGAGATYTLTGITRVSTCCRPVAGTIAVARNNGAARTWTFGPSCGDIVLDGVAVTSLPACL